MQIQIPGVAEHTWIGNEEVNQSGNRFYYSRNDNHRNGIGLIVRKRMTGLISISGLTEI